jgi:hypothetical protein
MDCFFRRKLSKLLANNNRAPYQVRNLAILL